MNEFKFDEKVSKTQRNPKNKHKINQFFNYIADNHSYNESSSDFETTCKIKNEDKIITAKPSQIANAHYFDEAMNRYQIPIRNNATIQWGKPLSKLPD